MFLVCLSNRNQEGVRKKTQGKRCRLIFGKMKDGSFSLPTWIKLISEIVGSCSSCFEPKLGMRTSGTILSVQMSAAPKLRLPGLVFHVRLGMEYVHGLPVYRGARTLYTSNLWRMTQMQLNNAEEGFLVGEEGLLRDTAHLQSLCAIITTETKSISKPCACVSVCPSVLAWGMCAYSAPGCVDTHMWRPETVLTCIPQSLSTLNAEFWSVTGWLIWLVWLAHLPWEFPASTVQMLPYPSSMWVPEVRLVSLSLKPAPAGVSSRKMLLIHHALQRNIHCSTDVDSRGVSRNGVKKRVPRIPGGAL